ncbi:hypothetical protein BCV70DRAFT_201090 [Testicularia cyperi]|uniref:Nucleoporin-domain-containing protein n=1 Tax=Testicularia cyperi TaxID=1882483 RepID=A0A317XMI9_9BASI|nr:hypothetical protein BCV70DRAFT_201090 [Testicularia cyperi]
MFTTPSRTPLGRASTPNDPQHSNASRAAHRQSRAGTPLFAPQQSQQPQYPHYAQQNATSPSNFLSPSAARAGEAADVSSTSLFTSGASRPRTTRSRPRPSSMLARSNPNASMLSSVIAFDREASFISDDADVRSIADTVHSAATSNHAGYGRRVTIAPKDSRGQLDEGTILLGDQWINVSAYSKLPTEVLDELENADLYIDAFQGHLEVQTGYAYLITRSKCFVWNYFSRGSGASPTCFTFPVPEYASSSMSAINDLAHCSFVPRGPNREPALLLVTPDGQTCLWEGISSSLTRQDRAQRLSAPLSSPSETVTKLQRVDDATLVLATSHSRLLRVSLGTRAGVLQAEIRPFAQPRGIFGRLFGSASSMGYGGHGITAIAVGPQDLSKQSRDIAAIGSKTIQKWQVLDQGGERLIAEQDVQQVVASGVLELSDERYSAAQSLAFELLDGAFLSDGKLVVLYSQAKAEHQPLSYGFATIDVVKDAGSFVVASILPLKHTSYADPRPYATPSLSIPNGGPAAFVTFADAVIIKQVEQGCETFEEVVKLKEDVRNRFIGTGCDAVKAANGAEVAALSLISTGSGSLLVETNTREIRDRCTAYSSSVDRQRADTQRLKGKLEQALYYSDSPVNPLTFQLPAQYEGTLMTACEQLSREVLTCTNPISQTVPFSVDLRNSLKDRLTKLRFLVRFVAECGHLEKLPQTTKRQLRADAELASALAELWIYQNEFYTQSSHAGAGASDHHIGQSPLAVAIETVMAEQGHGTADDVIRAFFRSHGDLTSQVLEQLLRRTRSVSTQPLRSRSIEILEMNRIALAAFRAALRYRKESGPMYGINADAQTAYEAWTAKSGSIQLLETLFSVTSNVIPDRSRELGSAIDAVHGEYAASSEEGRREQRIQTELKTQLASLSEIALACYDERLRYLEAVASSDAAYERELAVFGATYRSARPMFILPLVGISRSDRAFALAEQYQDFRTLVELANDPQLKSQVRVEAYLDKYKQKFAFELYAWYIEQGRPRVLLEQKPEYSELVLEYLDQSGNHRLGWLHDLALRRFDAASRKLENLAAAEPSLLQRKTMLSLGKLSFLSNLSVHDIQTVGTQKQIEHFDDQLDLIAVQNSLQSLWENSIGGLPVDVPAPGSENASVLVDEIVDTVATRLVEYPAYRSHYRDLVNRLLVEGRYLASEDLVDLLTLKDTPENQLEDFATAIKVLVRAKDAPAHRLQASLKAIWRRAVIRDDWTSLSDTNNVSDQTIMDDLCATALYAVLREVLADETNQSCYLDLQDLVASSSSSNSSADTRNNDDDEARQLVKARFPTAPDHFVSLLLQDEQKEVATVAAFLDDTDLPRLASEMATQAAQDAQADHDQDRTATAFPSRGSGHQLNDDDDNSMADD